MFSALRRGWILFCGVRSICLQVERISHNHLGRLGANELADFGETIAGIHLLGQDERLLVGYAFDQAKRSGHDVHLPIPDENVAVAAETPSHSCSCVHSHG